MKILLVDDHALFRQGLLLLLGKLPRDHEFIEATSCEEAFSLADPHPELGLILLDVSLPGLNGLDGLARFRAHWPKTPVVLLSANEQRRTIVDGIRRGARGFIPKSANAEIVLGALQVVLAGGTYVPAVGITDSYAPIGESTLLYLTARQQEVLALLVEGHSNREIGEALDMRVNTVRTHVAAILRALGVADREEAAQAAISLGLVRDKRRRAAPAPHDD
jgi:two-component system nitrate/nitrite response regulator NarL